MWIHFYNKNESSLCCHSKDIQNRVDCLSKKDLKKLKQLESVKRYMNTLGKTDIMDTEFKVFYYNFSY